MAFVLFFWRSGYHSLQIWRRIFVLSSPRFILLPEVSDSWLHRLGDAVLDITTDPLLNILELGGEKIGRWLLDCAGPDKGWFKVQVGQVRTSHSCVKWWHVILTWGRVRLPRRFTCFLDTISHRKQSSWLPSAAKQKMSKNLWLILDLNMKTFTNFCAYLHPCCGSSIWIVLSSKYQLDPTQNTHNSWVWLASSQVLGLLL